MSTDIGKKPDLRWLPVDRLEVDHRYQRTLESRRSEKLIENIAARFHWSAFQAILATADGRNGRGGASRWLIIDGQHRVEAARRVGIKEVPAVIVDAATLEEQAAAFVRANTDRVAVNPFALHRASVQGGDPAAVAIDKLCRKVGIEIPAYPIPADKLKPGQTLALATISTLPKRFGEGNAIQALRCVAEAYAEQSGALRAPIIQAVAAVVRDIHVSVRESRVAALTAWLRRTDPLKLSTRALDRKRRMGGTEANAAAWILADALKRDVPAAAQSGLSRPSRAQLMGRR